MDGFPVLSEIGRMVNIVILAIAGYSMVLHLTGGADPATKTRGYWIFLVGIFNFFDFFLLRAVSPGPAFDFFNKVQLSLIPFIVLLVLRDLSLTTGIKVRWLIRIVLILSSAVAAALMFPGALTFDQEGRLHSPFVYDLFFYFSVAESLLPIVLFAVWLIKRRAEGAAVVENGIFMLLYLAMIALTALDGIAFHLASEVDRVPLEVFGTFAATVYGIVTNSARFRATKRKMAFLADRDDLTGCYKRRNGVERIERMIMARGATQPFSVILVEFNNFKKINDLYGYGAGNLCLIEVARRLAGAMPPGSMVCRTEGDEYMAIAEGRHDDPHSSSILSFVFGALGEPVDLEGARIPVSFRAAASVYPDHGASASELLKKADDCLTRAKARKGQKFQAFNPELERMRSDFYRTEEALRAALDSPRRYERFVLHYQPKVDKSGKIRGLEGLARWINDGEIVPPARFIPVAEKAGLIDAIGKIVIDSGCRALAEWRMRRGWDINLSINLAPRQIDDPRLMEAILAAIANYGVDPGSFEVELTESTIMEPSEEERIMAFLRELSAKGVRTSIDDFGTGYSSLARIVDLPVNAIKIDRSIAMHSGREGKPRRVCMTAVRLAHELGMEAVAEGVDEADQADFIFGIGCDYIQGYHFYKPMPAAQIEALIGR
jgi:diguanylate cyclase (GGDEF)-like protein